MDLLVDFLRDLVGQLIHDLRQTVKSPFRSRLAGLAVIHTVPAFAGRGVKLYYQLWNQSPRKTRRQAPAFPSTATSTRNYTSSSLPVPILTGIRSRARRSWWSASAPRA